MTRGSDHSGGHSLTTVGIRPLKPAVFLCEMDLSRVFRRTRMRGVAALDLDRPDRRLGHCGAFHARREAATSVGARCSPARASCTSGSRWVSCFGLKCPSTIGRARAARWRWRWEQRRAARTADPQAAGRSGAAHAAVAVGPRRIVPAIGWARGRRRCGCTGVTRAAAARRRFPAHNR
jgi:hypothetical protein